MARIRSVHPGQPTDEDFVELSITARLFLIHLRCEADDNGVFKWQPKQLKIRIFPADHIEIEPLLEELIEHNHCIKYECNGRSYGALRNFRTYQRPQKPNPLHPINVQVAEYVGLKESEYNTSTVLVDDEYVTATGKVNQRERRGEEGIGEEGNGIRSSNVCGDDAPPPARKKSKKVEFSPEFETFWQEYPRRAQASGAYSKGSKVEANVEWQKLAPDDRIAARLGLTGYKAANPDRSKSVVDACRYLKKRRWLDFVGNDPPGYDRDDLLRRMKKLN